jgi:hypothetical protein
MEDKRQRSSLASAERDNASPDVASMNQPEAEDSRYDQEDCDDVIEELGHDKNENACDQGNDWLEMRDAERHVRVLLKHDLRKSADFANKIMR